MKVSSRSRLMHDPWGNRMGNRHSVIYLQWLVGLESDRVNNLKHGVDRGRFIYSEGNSRFVLGKRSVEKIRR